MGNNPVSGVDPDGQWVHLAVGALIGGAINLATNWKNIDGNFWKGLGYFGICAAAGALGAGIGTGIGASLGGSSFGAGFIGTKAAMSSISLLSGFTNGFLMGGGSGFSSGFISGTGNGLINGENFGGALETGIKNGLISGIGGGIFGGTSLGIKALGQNKSFWDGATVTKSNSIMADAGPLPAVQQIGEKDCAFGCLESINRANGGTNNQTYHKNLMGGTNNGTTPNSLLKAAGYNAGAEQATSTSIKNSILGRKFGILSLTTTENSLNHAVVPSKLVFRQVVRSFAWKDAITKSSFLISGMNPATGTNGTLWQGTANALYKLQWFPIR